MKGEHGHRLIADVTDQPKPTTHDQVKTDHRVGATILQQSVVRRWEMWAAAQRPSKAGGQPKGCPRAGIFHGLGGLSGV